MTKLLFALLDVKTDMFLAPIAVVTPGEAERMYGELLQSDSIVGKHPHDFPLYQIGSYDDRSGIVAPNYSGSGAVEPPRLFVDAAAVLKPRKEA